MCSVSEVARVHEGRRRHTQRPPAVPSGPVLPQHPAAGCNELLWLLRFIVRYWEIVFTQIRLRENTARKQDAARIGLPLGLKGLKAFIWDD